MAHFSPKIVLIIGCESAMIAAVVGTKIIAVYLTDDEKTVCSSSPSSFGLIFENAGKSTVDIGVVTKVSKVANCVATW